MVCVTQTSIMVSTVVATSFLSHAFSCLNVVYVEELASSWGAGLRAKAAKRILLRACPSTHELPTSSDQNCDPRLPRYLDSSITADQPPSQTKTGFALDFTGVLVHFNEFRVSVNPGQHMGIFSPRNDAERSCLATAFCLSAARGQHLTMLQNTTNLLQLWHVFACKWWSC